MDLPEGGCDLEAVLSSVERRLIEQALDRTGAVRKAAAKVLGVSFRSLRYRMSKLGIEGAEGDEGGEAATEDEG